MKDVQKERLSQKGDEKIRKLVKMFSLRGDNYSGTFGQ